MIVGAGVSGLVAARQLVEYGHEVVLLERRPCVGGRLSSVEVGGARLDDAAQFIHVTHPETTALLESWADQGLVSTWCRGLDGMAASPWFIGCGGMGTLAGRLAKGLDVRLGIGVTRVAAARSAWQVQWSDGQIDGRAVVLTPPLPECYALLEWGEARTAEYRPAIAVLAVLDRPSALDFPGAAVVDAGPLRWVADNALKGVSPVSALTIHPTPDWAAAWFNRPDDEITDHLFAAASEFVADATVAASTVRRWRYGSPAEIAGGLVSAVPGPGPLVIAGDGFAPLVEGAIRSGLAAAEVVHAGCRD